LISYLTFTLQCCFSPPDTRFLTTFHPPRSPSLLTFRLFTHPGYSCRFPFLSKFFCFPCLVPCDVVLLAHFSVDLQSECFVSLRPEFFCLEIDPSTDPFFIGPENYFTLPPQLSVPNPQATSPCRFIWSLFRPLPLDPFPFQ